VYALDVGVVVGSADLQREVSSCISSLPVRVVLEQRELGDAAGFIEKLERVQPDVVLFGYQLLPPEELPHAIAQIKATSGSPAVILVNSQASPDLILRGLRSGADEYLFPPLGNDLTAALERISMQRARTNTTTRPRGKVFAILGAKGGCGATTLACHLSVELHRQTSLDVLLADFDQDSGMVGFLMKSKARYSLTDAMSAAHRLDMSLWKALVSNGHPGVEVLTAPAASTDREPLDPKGLRYIVPFVRSAYPWTILDLGRSLSRPAFAALDEADETLLVTTADIPALHQAKQIIRTLLDGGFKQQRLHVVLNRTPRRLEVTVDELERMLSVPVYETISEDYSALYEAYSSGALLPANSNLGKQFARIAARMAGVSKRQKSGYSFLPW
jgi:pilus assembly protein CpaE